MSETPPHTDYYSVRITAAVLGVHRSTVFRYIAAGKLHAIRFRGDYYCCQKDLSDYQYHYLLPQELKDGLSVIIGRMRDSILREKYGTVPRTEPGISGSADTG